MKKYITTEKELIKEISKQYIMGCLFLFAILAFLVGLLVYFCITEGFVSLLESPLALIFLLLGIALFSYFFFKNLPVIFNPREKSETYKRFNGNIEEILEAIKDVNENTIYQDYLFKLSKHNICLYSTNSNIINYKNYLNYKIVGIKTNGILTNYSLQIHDTTGGYIAYHYDFNEKEKINKITSLLESNFAKNVSREIEDVVVEQKAEIKQEITSTKQFCTKCGKELETNWEFCRFCGNKIK